THQDYPTFNFLQWYVAEQHEEEKLFKSVIDKLSLAGDINNKVVKDQQKCAGRKY
ncbi:ferritin-like domain-containing protein, partial [Citrobacter freundii]|uniref:ferritin-like domain-containing protein n=1 Tax=Citrobacter freundii TaxID=546 RepID=UPI002F96DCAE